MAEIVITAVGLVMLSVAARAMIRVHRAEQLAKGHPEWAEAGAFALTAFAVLASLVFVVVALVR